MIDDPPEEQAAEQVAEQVFDYFLHELISGQSPPDLSLRITAAWSREQAELASSVARPLAAHRDLVDQATQPVIARPVRAPAAVVLAADTLFAAGTIRSDSGAQANGKAQSSIKAQPIAAPQLIVARPIHSGSAAHGSATHDSGESASASQGISLRRQVVAALLATGACGLLTLLSWQLVDPDRALTQRVLELARDEVRNLANPPMSSPAAPAQPNSTALPASETTSPPSLADSLAASSDSSERAGTSQKFAADTAQKRDLSQESIALFPLDQRSVVSDSPPADVLQDGASESTVIAATTALESHQIVAQIDRRLTRVWEELSVTPSPKMDESQRALQVSLVLTGQPPSGAVGDLHALTSEATASLPFARQWADRFVDEWLAGSNLPAEDSRVQTLRKHFAEYIYEGRPWNATALELLGGSLAADPPADRNLADSEPADSEPADSEPSDGSQALAIAAEPSAPDVELNPVASAFVSALAGDGNHRLVSHIGANFLDVDLSCARCHDVNSSGLTAEWSENDQDVDHVAGRQAMYWSLTAMLQGIDTRIAEDGAQVVIDRQTELLAAGKPLTAYYDLLDGRLQAVEPRLPDGQAWETIADVAVPRQALAVWLSQSPAMDEATVNQVWRMIFGQPLVSRNPIEFNVSTSSVLVADQSPMQSSERQQRELLELLSAQYRAHGHDLKQLVAWIVHSDAFRRQPTRHTRAQWLAASQDDLRQWQVARASFASGVRSADTATTNSLEKSLVMVLQWRERSSSGAETTLAQPVPNLAPAPTPDIAGQSPDSGDASSQGSDSGLKDRLRLNPPLAAELAFVDRLLASQRLSWKDRVEHLVCLTPELRPDDRIQFLADELLRQHKGDARAALLDLLWAVKR